MTLSTNAKKRLLKVLKGTLISSGAAAVTYLIASLNFIDVDVYTPLIVAGAGAVLNAVLEFFKHQKELLEKEQ